MSISRWFEPDVGAVVFEVVGNVQLSEMMTAVMAWFADPEFVQGAPALVDFKDADWLSMYADYQHVPDAIFNKVIELGPMQDVAFVLASGTEQLIMEMIRNQRPWPMTWRYFDDREAAMEWLARHAATAAEP